MTKRSRSSHRPLVADLPDSRTDVRKTIYSAVELLRAKHGVPQTSAYWLLVQASVEAGMNVRETAARIVEESRGTV